MRSARAEDQAGFNGRGRNDLPFVGRLRLWKRHADIQRGCPAETHRPNLLLPHCVTVRVSVWLLQDLDVVCSFCHQGLRKNCFLGCDADFRQEILDCLSIYSMCVYTRRNDFTPPYVTRKCNPRQDLHCKRSSLPLFPPPLLPSNI